MCSAMIVSKLKKEENLCMYVRYYTCSKISNEAQWALHTYCFALKTKLSVAGLFEVLRRFQHLFGDISAVGPPNRHSCITYK